MDVLGLAMVPAGGSAISAERGNDIEGEFGREPLLDSMPVAVLDLPRTGAWRGGRGFL